MKAIEITSYGAPKSCASPSGRTGRRPRSAADPVAASGVNRPDVLQRTGNYPCRLAHPTFPGWKSRARSSRAMRRLCARQALQLAITCARWWPVAATRSCVAPVAQCLPVPKGLTRRGRGDAARDLLHRLEQRVRTRASAAGETLLIQGGSSGIGVTAIQFAKAFGATVIVTAGSDEKCKACLKLGADMPSTTRRRLRRRGQEDHGRQGRRRRARHGGRRLRGARGGMPGRGRPHRDHRRAGRQPEINAGLVLRKRLTITGSTLRPRRWPSRARSPRRCATRCGRSSEPAHQAGHPRTFRRPGQPSGATKAHALMESNEHIGKIVLTWCYLLDNMSKNKLDRRQLEDRRQPRGKRGAGQVRWSTGAEQPSCDVAVCVPAAYLYQAQGLLANSPILLGAQDVSAHPHGAFTGEAVGRDVAGIRRAPRDRRAFGTSAVSRRDRRDGGHEGQGRAGRRHHPDRLRGRDAGASARPAKPTRWSSGSWPPSFMSTVIA